MVSLDEQSVQDLYDSLANGSYKSIVLVLGAGISVSAGIPDFRSPGGLFEAVKEHFGEKFPKLMENPEHLLSRTFCLEHPEIWENEVVPMLRSWKLEDAKPTMTHKMICWLHNQGWLTRVYTQNIDGLELHPEIQELSNNYSEYSKSIVQAHGSMREGTVVLYGDKLSKSFYKACEEDFSSDKNNVDLVIVMGTSLQVAPFCSIPNLVPKNATRVLVDPCPSRVISLNSWTITTKLAGRNVELGSLWNKRKSPWKQEILIESTSDDFVRKFFESDAAIQKGWTLQSCLQVELIEVRSKGKMHLCEVVSKDDDKVTIKRCKDGRKIQISSVSYKKVKNKSYSS